ncbi:hypothetical protein D3C78_1319800 [compost metagenome]
MGLVVFQASHHVLDQQQGLRTLVGLHPSLNRTGLQSHCPKHTDSDDQQGHQHLNHAETMTSFDRIHSVQLPPLLTRVCPPTETANTLLVAFPAESQMAKENVELNRPLRFRLRLELETPVIVTPLMLSLRRTFVPCLTSQPLLQLESSCETSTAARRLIASLRAYKIDIAKPSLAALTRCSASMD